MKDSTTRGYRVQIETSDGPFEITDVLERAWQIKYPTADLRREHPLMVLWLTKHPARRPKNAIRFIEAWLKRTEAQERRNLEETSKRGAASAARIGERFSVVPRPGESQEHFNRRVIAACASSVVKPIRGPNERLN